MTHALPERLERGPLGARELAAARWPELARRRPVLVVPLGSLEQHGPHLPLATDTLVAVALCGAVGAHRPDVVVAPPLAVGASGEHEGFPGTLSIGTEVLSSLLTELVRSARSWARAVVVVSAHGGNADALARASATARHEGDALVVHVACVAGGDAHAGRTETSLVLALAPQLVGHNDAVAGETAPIGAIAGRLRAEGVRAVSPNGVLGDPRGASAVEGRRLLDQLALDACAAVDAALGEPR